jgi:hypothetical protein
MFKFIKDISFFAILSLIFSISFWLSIFISSYTAEVIALISPFLAVLLGIIALYHIKKKGLKGKKIAKTGIILGILGIVLLFSIPIILG